MSLSRKSSYLEAMSSMRSQSPASSSSLRSPASSRLASDFESAFSMEAEGPIRFSTADILPYLSAPSSSSSSSDFDSQSDSTGSTSFCNFDSNRITLGSLIGLPMDSFRHFGESFRFITRADSQYDSGSNRTIDRPPRRSRSCNLLADIVACLSRTRADYIPKVTCTMDRASNNLSSFTITEVSEEEEQGTDDNCSPRVFENAVFEDRPSFGGSKRIFELNPLYISDVISEVDPGENRDADLPKDVPQVGNLVRAKAEDLKHGESSQINLESIVREFSPSRQPPSNIRSILTTICCRLSDGDDSQSD